MEIYVSYYGTVMLDPERVKDYASELELLVRVARNFEDETSPQKISFDRKSGRLEIDLEGVIDSGDHKKVIRSLQALGRFAKGVGNFTVEQESDSFTIWIGAENDVRRTKVQIYLHAAIQLLEKASILSDNPKDLESILRLLKGMRSGDGEGLSLLPPL